MIAEMINKLTGKEYADFLEGTAPKAGAGGSVPC